MFEGVVVGVGGVGVLFFVVEIGLEDVCSVDW